MSRYLFVGGPPRSGTTAFTNLLNSHPKIALGLERYKFIYGPHPDEVSEDLFKRERFFQLEERETNVKSPKMMNSDQFKKKFDRVVYKGDKVPNILRYHRTLNERLLRCRYIILYRNVYRICSSWNVRAKNPNDHWPEKNDFRVAVDAINKEMALAAVLQRKQPQRYLIVRYENVFGENGHATVARTLDWLKLKEHPRVMKAFANSRKIAAKVEEKPLVELDDQREFVDRNINWSVVKQVEAVAI